MTSAHHPPTPTTPHQHQSHQSQPLATPTTPIHRLSLPLPSRLLLSTTLTFPSSLALGLFQGTRTSSLRFRAENAHRLPKSQAGWYLYYKSKTYATLLGGAKEGVRNGIRVSFWSAVFLACEEVVDRGRRAGVGLWAGVGGGHGHAYGHGHYGYRYGDSSSGGGGRQDNGEAVKKRIWAEELGKGVGYEHINTENANSITTTTGTGGVDALGTVIASLATAGAFCLWNRFSYATSVRTAKRGLAFGVVYGVAQDLLRALKGDGVAGWMRWIGWGKRGELRNADGRKQVVP